LLATPETPTDEVVISVHGMQSNCLKRREDILGKNFVSSGIAHFAFNNRGHELRAYIKKVDGNSKPEGGSSYEDVLEGYYDVKGAINKMLELGFNKIHLQGHSLGCTKIVYTYNKLKKENNLELLGHIKSVILLSLVDIVGIQKEGLKEERYNKMMGYAIEKEEEGNTLELMPEESFPHPISVKTYLRYFRDNGQIDFARFSDKGYDYKELNNIEKPLFLRWGTVYEEVTQDLDELIELLKSKISNEKLDIGYIKGADHSYYNKEDVLGTEIMFFIKYIAD